MKKTAYKILIYIFILLFFAFLFIKIDTGVDVKEANDFEPLVEKTAKLEPSINKTIDNVDYLQTQSAVGKHGGSYKTSIIGDPKTFNPYNANDATSSELSELMYDGLLQTNPFNGKVVPKLAKSFKVLDDKKTYIINLRHGIKWSDGVEITADDVYFTYNTIIFAGFGDADGHYACGICC